MARKILSLKGAGDLPDAMHMHNHKQTSQKMSFSEQKDSI
jgi:hypothetical protein